MQKINTMTIGKIAATVAGISLVAMSVAVAVPAHAQTTTTTTTTMSAAQVAALQAQIASLQAQLSAATGAGASVAFTRDLTIGSTGADVTALQNWLISKGYSIPAGATGYFGTQTRAAVAAYQTANGISPTAGYFGPVTRAKVNAAGGSTTTTTTTTTSPTTLTGGEGSVNNFIILGSPSNTTVYQGQMAQVFGFQFVASGSDLDVQRVDLDVTNNGAVVNGGSGQDRPWDILQTATLYDGSHVIGTVDASNQNNWSQDGTEFTSHQTYRIEFTGLNDVVKNGAQANYYVAFTAQNGVSTANQTQYSVQVASQGIRAVDALGLQEYSSGSQSTGVTFSVSNGTAGTVIISTGSDNPSATTIVGNSTSATQNVTLGTFTIQSQNASTQIFQLPVTLTIGTTTNNVNPVQDLKLVENGNVLQSVAAPAVTSFLGATGAATSSIVFNNLTNVVIPAGTTQEFQLQADINPVSSTVSGDAGDGSSASVAVSGSASGLDFEQGSNRVTPSGGMTGNTQTFRSFGINATVTAGTPTFVTSGGGDNTGATFSFSVPVTAFNQNVYIGTTSSAFTSTIHTSTTTYAASGVISSNAPKDTASGAYVVYPGSTQTFNITVTTNGTNYGAGLNYATLDNIKWGNAGNTTAGNTFTFPSGSGNQSSAVTLAAS
jgi:peptidoglycan hydrolase-like protein with peptidoglycan-binding domain